MSCYGSRFESSLRSGVELQLVSCSAIDNTDGTTILCWGLFSAVYGNSGPVCLHPGFATAVPFG